MWGGFVVVFFLVFWGVGWCGWGFWLFLIPSQQPSEWSIPIKFKFDLNSMIFKCVILNRTSEYVPKFPLLNVSFNKDVKSNLN